MNDFFLPIVIGVAFLILAEMRSGRFRAGDRFTIAARVVGFLFFGVALIAFCHLR